jgi:probable addiction module antidote protein
MSGQTRSYKDGLHRRLQDNNEALHYLQAALEDSRSAFLVALKNVLDARNVAEVARASKLNRVHIYRMLAGEGNPTVASLEKLLHALGLRLTVALQEPAPPVRRTKIARKTM